MDEAIDIRAKCLVLSTLLVRKELSALAESAQRVMAAVCECASKLSDSLQDGFFSTLRLHFPNLKPLALAAPDYLILLCSTAHELKRHGGAAKAFLADLKQTHHINWKATDLNKA